MFGLSYLILIFERFDDILEILYDLNIFMDLLIGLVINDWLNIFLESCLNMRTLCDLFINNFG